ncbi:MAG TPA: peptidylprolyl isomerase [Ktedonobacterales bacterium]|nr:peptidylprolyl isomerase [Ktedonobacterales bacterium]
MSNQTLQKPPRQNARSRASARNAQFKRQTARLEGRRDGKPLIFGWGGHLTKAQKSRYQRAAAYGFLGVVIGAIILTLVLGVLNQNVFIPNKTFVKVNGVSYTQDSYRKLLAYNAQSVWNKLQLEIHQMNELQTKIQQGDAQASQQNQILLSMIQTDEAAYQQASITASTATLMVEDQLIQQGARRFEQQNRVPASTFTPTKAEIDKAVSTFKTSFPENEKYSDFLAKNGMTEADVRSFAQIQLRRDKMQAYLQTQLKSPIRQAHLRHIEVGSQADAQKVLDQLKKTGDWNGLAKKYSLDVDTKDKGGDMGWISPGLGDAGVEIWWTDSARKVDDISGPIHEASGTYDVVQIVGFDDNRPVDASKLSDAKANILSHWLGGEKVRPGYHISTPDSDMVNADRNMPKVPDLNATLPNVSGAQSVPQLPKP